MPKLENLIKLMVFGAIFVPNGQQYISIHLGWKPPKTVSQAEIWHGK